jgi:hypothetical protein
MPKLIVTNVVYGKEYTNTFLYTLHSQLTNFQFLYENSYPVAYRIYTTQEDKIRILNSKVFQKIKILTKIDFIKINPFLNVNPYYTLINCHNDAIKYVNEIDAVIVFLLPDIILSNNVFEKICRSLANKKRVLVASVLRLNKEDFEKYVSSESLIGINPRQLIKRALLHLHQLTYDVCWHSKKIFFWTAILWWKLDQNNLLIRGFHLHPLFVWPLRKKYKCKGTFDDEFVSYSCPDKSAWEVLSNSDEAVLFELTSKKRKNDDVFFTKKLKTIFDFVKKYIHANHLYYAKTKIYLLTTEYKKAIEWKIKENQSDKIINMLPNYFAFFFIKKLIKIKVLIKHVYARFYRAYLRFNFIRPIFKELKKIFLLRNIYVKCLKKYRIFRKFNVSRKKILRKLKKVDFKFF